MIPTERVARSQSVDFNRIQLQHFRAADPRCRGMQLPEGILLRYTLSEALYFYLRTGVKEGQIITRIFASDSPYDPKKTRIGDVCTPMFEPQADYNHLDKLQRMLRSWVQFVRTDSPQDQDFTAFPVDGPGD